MTGPINFSTQLSLFYKTRIKLNCSDVFKSFIFKKFLRCKSFDKFDTLLNKIEKDIQEIEVKIASPEAKIREHCEKIRNQIDLNTEILIEKINNYRDQLITEINNYEQECIKSLKPIDKKDCFHKMIQENDIKLKEFYRYINKYKIDENKIKQMMLEAKIQEYQLKDNLKKINNKLFGESLISFEDLQRQIDSSIIGRFSYESLKIESDVIDIEKVINNKVEKTIQYKADKVVPLISDKYLVASGNYLKIIDESGQVFVEIRFDYDPICFSHNNLDSIFVLHHRNMWKNSSKLKNQFNTLSIYDFNLNLKNEITPELSLLTCSTNNQNIFVQLEKSFVIQTYSWSLEKVNSFGQNFYVDKPYFFKDFVLKMVKNDKIYLGNTNTNENGHYVIRAVCLSTGEVLNEYKLNCTFDNFFIDALSRTVVVDNSSLKIYDKPSGASDQAELIYEADIDLGHTNGYHMTQDGRFFFVKDKHNIQYFSFCNKVIA